MNNDADDDIVYRPIEVAKTCKLVAWTRRDITNGEELLKCFRDYYELKQGDPLSITGFSSFLGCGPSKITNLKSIFPEQYSFIKQVIEQSIVENALIGKYNGSFAQFLLKNKFDGYSAADIEIAQVGSSPDDINKIREELRKIREEKIVKED